MLKHRLHPPYDLGPPGVPAQYIRACKSTTDPERGVDLHFIYVGHRGAVQFGMATNWHVWEMGNVPRWPIPLGVAIHHGLHGGAKCPILGFCKFEGLGDGGDLIELLVKGGDEAVWTKLEAIYRARTE